MIHLRFVRSSGFLSAAIVLREGLCMPFTPSHVECVSPDGLTYIGQHIDGGMLARSTDYDRATTTHEAFVDLPADDAQTAAFYAAAHASIGEPYDWKAIAGFGPFPADFHFHAKLHAICSAKMFLLLRGCGWFANPVAVPAHCIDPRDLLLILSTHVLINH